MLRKNDNQSLLVFDINALQSGSDLTFESSAEKFIAANAKLLKETADAINETTPTRIIVATTKPTSSNFSTEHCYAALIQQALDHLINCQRGPDNKADVLFDTFWLTKQRSTPASIIPSTYNKEYRAHALNAHVDDIASFAHRAAYNTTNHNITLYVMSNSETDVHADTIDTLFSDSPELLPENVTDIQHYLCDKHASTDQEALEYIRYDNMDGTQEVKKGTGPLNNQYETSTKHVSSQTLLAAGKILPSMVLSADRLQALLSPSVTAAATMTVVGAAPATTTTTTSPAVTMTVAPAAVTQPTEASTATSNRADEIQRVREEAEQARREAAQAKRRAAAYHQKLKETYSNPFAEYTNGHLNVYQLFRVIVKPAPGAPNTRTEANVVGLILQIAEHPSWKNEGTNMGIASLWGAGGCIPTGVDNIKSSRPFTLAGLHAIISTKLGDYVGKQTRSGKTKEFYQLIDALYRSDDISLDIKFATVLQFGKKHNIPLTVPQPSQQLDRRAS